MSFVSRFTSLTKNKKFAIRLSMASGLTTGYCLTCNDPWLSISYRWRIRDISLSKYLLAKLSGTMVEEEGMCSEKPSILPPLQTLIDQVKSKVTIPEDHLGDIHLIPLDCSMPGPALGKAGISNSYASIPDHFNASSIDDLRAHKLSKLIKKTYGVSLDKDDWISGAGRELIKSFILSEKAKKFVIAHQMYAAEYSPFFMKPLIMFVTIYAYFFATDRALSSLGTTGAELPAGRFMILFVSLACLFMIGWQLYNKVYIDGIHWIDADARAISHGALSVSQMDEFAKAVEEARLMGKKDDETIIEKTQKIDEEMVEGAVEFYSKLITRHLALKDICKKNDKFYEFNHRRFTYEGRFNGKGFVIRFKHRPSESLHKIRSWTSYVYR